MSHFDAMRNNDSLNEGGIFLERAMAYHDATYLNLAIRSYAFITKFANYYANRTFAQLVEAVYRNFAALWWQNAATFAFETTTIVIGGIVLLLMRNFLFEKVITEILYRRQMVRAEMRASFAKSAYNLAFYTVSFSLAATLVHCANYIDHPERMWSRFAIDQQPSPFAIRALYRMEFSFYISECLVTVFGQQWNAHYTPLLLFHHIVSLLLLLIATGSEAGHVGIFVLYTHDAADVFKDLLKVVTKLHFDDHYQCSAWRQQRRLCALLNFGRRFTFCTFVPAWFFFRLYLFPLWAINSFAVLPFTEDVGGSPDFWPPFLSLLFILLWFIFLMDIYWSALIIRMAINITLFGVHNIIDFREPTLPKQSSPRVSIVGAAKAAVYESNPNVVEQDARTTTTAAAAGTAENYIISKRNNAQSVKEETDFSD